MTEVTVDRVISKLNELKLLLSPEIDYRVEIMFPRVEGVFVDREIRKKFQLLQRIEPVLRELLLEHEQVQFVSKGKVKLVDTVLVFTNCRLLCLHTNNKGESKQAFSFIYYTQIADLKTTNSWSSRDDLTVALKDGGKVTVPSLLEIDRKAMLTVYQNAQKVLNEQGFDPPVSQSRENLCGNCLKVVPMNEHQCVTCRATFWKTWDLAIRCFIFPPWCNFTMNNYLTACGQIAYFFLMMIIISISLFRGDYGYALMIFMVFYFIAVRSTWLNLTNGLYLKKVPNRV